MPVAVILTSNVFEDASVKPEYETMAQGLNHFPESPSKQRRSPTPPQRSKRASTTVSSSPRNLRALPLLHQLTCNLKASFWLIKGGDGGEEVGEGGGVRGIIRLRRLSTAEKYY